MRKLSLVLAALIAFSLAPATVLAQGGLSGISSGATTNVFTNGVFSGAGTPNDPTTGTDLGATAKFVNNAGVVNLKKCGTSDTMCFKVTKETAGGTTGVLTGNAYVDGAFAEADTCSNACVVNNWVKESTTAAGQVMDTGTVNTSPCPSGATCLGFAMTAGSGLQTIVRLSPTVGVSAGAPTAITTGYLWLPSGTFPPLTGIVATVVPSVTAINNINLMQVTVLYPMTFGHASVMFKTQSNQAGSICDFGLYDNTGTKVYSKGGFDCVATATGNVSVTASFTLNPGIYWMASCTSNITATAAAFDGYAAVADVQTTMNQFTQKKYGIITSGCTAGVLPGSITLSSIAASNAGIVMQFMEP